MKEASLHYIFNKRRDLSLKLRIQTIFLCAITIIASVILNGLTAKTTIISISAVIVCAAGYLGLKIVFRSLADSSRKIAIQTKFPIENDMLTATQQELILLDMDYFFNESGEVRKNRIPQNNKLYPVIIDLSAVKGKIENGEQLTSTEMEALSKIYSLESFNDLGR